MYIRYCCFRCGACVCIAPCIDEVIARCSVSLDPLVMHAYTYTWPNTTTTAGLLNPFYLSVVQLDTKRSCMCTTEWLLIHTV